MKKILLLIISLFIFENSLAFNLDNRRKEIVKIIDEEIFEVNRLMKSQRSADLMLRKAELYLEKARLYRDIENKEFLSLSESKRRKINKRGFYNRSAKLFSQANKICINITKQFPRYSKIGDVYYILGYNAKEANKEKRAAKYLQIATKKATDKRTVNRSQISLAEVYYNQKQYKKAIPLYERSLRTPSDKWWTKDSFNLAWCYFRNNQYSKAITKMREIFDKSSNSRFIDMRSQVERDIGQFYALSGRIDEGISFYKKIGINFTDQLLRISSSLMAKGKFADANKTLGYALKYEKDEQKLVEIHIERLVLAEKFSAYKVHENSSKSLFSLYKKDKFTKNQLTTYKFQLQKVAAKLQKQVVSKTYRRLKKKRYQKADQAILYFDYLSQIESKKSDEYLYLMAETAYSAGQLSRSYGLYKRTFEFTKNKKSRFKLRSMNSMLVVLAKLKSVSNSEKEYVLNEFIQNYPKDKRSIAIHERLFNLYVSQNNEASAKRVLDSLVKYYPRTSKQEPMIALLMEKARKRKDGQTIRKWINLISSGSYRVSKKYQTKLQQLLTSLQIDDVQRELEKGNKKTALLGYHKILEDKYSTKKSRINAKYNLAALYYELGDYDQNYKWAMESLKEMPTKNVKSFADSFLTFSSFLFDSLEFKKSHNLGVNLLGKICRVGKRKQKNIIFKNSAYISLAEKDLSNTESLIRLGKKCKVSKSEIENVEFELTKEYLKQKDWRNFERLTYRILESKQYYPEGIDFLLELRDLNIRFNNSNNIKKFERLANRYFKRAKKERRSVSMKSLDYFAALELEKLGRTVNQMNLIKLTLPPKTLQKRQNSILKLLEALVDQANKLQQIGSGVGIVSSYKVLSDAHAQAANNTKSFLDSQIKHPNYSSMRNAFLPLVTQLQNASNSYKVEAMNAIKRNAILNKDNSYFQINKFPVFYYGEDMSVLMDRGGK